MSIFNPTPDNPNPRLGFCYVLSNDTVRSESGEPILKIGATRKHPIERAREVSAGTGVATPFTLAYYRDFNDAFLAERLIHEALAQYRVNESREFFAAPLEVVIACMASLTEDATYQEGLESGGLVGGVSLERRPVKPVATPFADLFATFADRGDGVLNAEEQAACRALEATTRG